MNWKSLAAGAAMVIGTVAADPGFATTLIGPLNDPTGVAGLVVDGTAFNVTFTGLKLYDQEFASSQPYYLNDLSGSLDAAAALAAFFNSVGATDDRFGDLQIPDVRSAGSFQSAFVQYDTFMHPPRWITGGLGSTDTALYRWALFSTAQASIPAALPLFVSALGGLGFVGWRRRQSAG